MIEREDKVSVYIGNGVAIPHGVGGSEKYIKKSGLSFLQKELTLVMERLHIL